MKQFFRQTYIVLQITKTIKNWKSKSYRMISSKNKKSYDEIWKMGTFVHFVLLVLTRGFLSWFIDVVGVMKGLKGRFHFLRLVQLWYTRRCGQICKADGYQMRAVIDSLERRTLTFISLLEGSLPVDVLLCIRGELQLTTQGRANVLSHKSRGLASLSNWHLASATMNFNKRMQ